MLPFWLGQGPRWEGQFCQTHTETAPPLPMATGVGQGDLSAPEASTPPLSPCRQLSPDPGTQLFLYPISSDPPAHPGGCSPPPQGLCGARTPANPIQASLQSRPLSSGRAVTRDQVQHESPVPRASAYLGSAIQPPPSLGLGLPVCRMGRTAAPSSLSRKVPSPAHSLGPGPAPSPRGRTLGEAGGIPQRPAAAGPGSLLQARSNNALPPHNSQKHRPPCPASPPAWRPLHPPPPQGPQQPQGQGLR